MNVNDQLGRTVEILLVEDSPTDADLTKQAFVEGKVLNNLHHVCDGVEALAFLRREGTYGDRPRPDLILLDLNMPRMDGRETLRAIRSDPLLRHLVVVILTTSSHDKDVMEAYNLNVNAYIVKPVDLNQFFQIVRDIDHFYCRVITLPPTAA